MNETGPQTLIEAVRYFADLGVCFRYMVQLKWPSGTITCPKCGSDKTGVIASRSLLQCKDKECRYQFSAKVGTIFEDSPLPLSSWFPAVWSIANAKVGISSCELARALGVRQGTAWFMLHRIREATGGAQAVLSTQGQGPGRNAGKGIDMKKQPKESGGKAMDDLARRLLQVPKAELDEQLRKHKARKRKPKK